MEELKAKISEKLVIVLVFTLFTVVMLAGVKIIDAFTQAPAAVQYQKYVNPLPTSYDTKMLNEFVERDTGYTLIDATTFESGGTSGTSSTSGETTTGTTTEDCPGISPISSTSGVNS